jgi:hypothetical protein
MKAFQDWCSTSGGRPGEASNISYLGRFGGKLWITGEKSALSSACSDEAGPQTRTCRRRHQAAACLAVSAHANTKTRRVHFPQPYNTRLLKHHPLLRHPNASSALVLA